MASRVRSIIENEKFLDYAIRTVVSLIIAVILIIIGYRYYFYNVKQVENLRVNQVIKELEAQVRKNPLNINARIQLASAYISVKRYDDAIQQCLEVLKVDKENQAALTMAGFAYMQKGEYNKALEMYKKEIDTYASAGMALENKYLEEALFNTGVIYWKKGDLDKAIYYVNRAALIRRTDADVHFFLGRLYYEKGLLNNGETYFQKAIRFDPKYLDAHVGLARVYEKLKLYGMAVNEYERAYAIDNTKKEFREKSDQLLEKLENMAEKNPEFETLVQLGYAYMGRKEWDKAYKSIKKAIELKPDDPLGYYALGYTYEREWAYYRDKDSLRAEKARTEALKAYDKCISIDKEYEGALAGKKRIQLGITEEEVILRDVKVIKK
jgi:tetratricopeptide (TPR) repeat protein